MNNTYARVALHPQGVVVHIPISEGKLLKQNLQSQFPGATGLKYVLNGTWTAVPVLGSDRFNLPEGDHLYVVITDAIDKGRHILSNTAGPLVSQVAKIFNPRRSAAYNIDARGNLPRKHARTVMNKKPFSKPFKVCFIRNVELPIPFCRTLILSEGMFILSNNDDEITIKHCLLDMLGKTTDTSVADISVENLTFLSYGNKKLSVPYVPNDFVWNGENLKANIGQGKLYVMVNSCNLSESDTELPPLHTVPTTRSSTISSDTELQQSLNTVPSTRSSKISVTELPSLHTVPSSSSSTMTYGTDLPDIPSVNDDQSINSSADNIDTGTPTITFRRRTRRSLSLHSRRDNGEENKCTNSNTYRSYLNLINDDIVSISDDSENEETTNKDCSDRGTKTLTELLVILKSKLDLEQNCRFNINRRDVLDGARRAIHRKSFNPKYRISVKFADDCGTAEGAIDEGGPTRELLRMLLKEIQNLSIFEGPINKRQLTLNSAALMDNLYKDVGTIIALSLVHGGPTPKFFSQILYQSVVYGINKSHVRPTIEDVYDADLKSQIEKLKKAEDILDIGHVLEQMASLLVVSGCMRPITNMEQKDKLMQDLLFFLVLGRTSEGLSQLSMGLETLGVLKVMKEYPNHFAELFTFSPGENLTAEMVEAVFLDIKYSTEGSNRRANEEKMIGYWRDFLIDIEEQDKDGELSLKGILVFATGADAVPPLGFDPLPSVTFQHHGEPFPKAHTCAMNMCLPIVENYEVFKENMIFGIANSPGFGVP